MVAEDVVGRADVEHRAGAPAAALVADVPGLAELPAGAPAPHAHQARFTPAGLITTDLGLDLVREVAQVALGTRDVAAGPDDPW